MPYLFKELEFTAENVIKWAEEVSKEEDVQTILTNVVTSQQYFAYQYVDQDELIDKVIEFLRDGINKPYRLMSNTELANSIVELCDCSSMDDFLKLPCTEDYRE